MSTADAGPAKAARKRRQPEPVAEPARALKVLVVEDNRDTAETMRLLLEAWGHSAKIAHNGMTALDMADEYRPDVVLLDIVLPRMHGNDVARHLRERPWAANIPLVAVTAWGQDADRQLSKAAGINHHLLKPVDPKRLQKLLVDISHRET
jgi:two-component system CheB/CheR fusion protein